MTWVIIIVALIVLLYVRNLFNTKISASYNRSASRNAPSLWDGLCLKFRKYLDFTQRSMLPDRMEIGNQKGETFTFQKGLTDIVVTYTLKGAVIKTWKFPFWVAVNTAYKNIDDYYKAELQPKTISNPTSDLWIITNSRPFTQEEISQVNDTRVVKCQYGLSVEFSMKKGGVTYIPLMGKDNLPVDAKINLKTAKILTLSKDGQKDIYRIQV